MKAKLLILLIVSAILTLSFTFSSKKNSDRKTESSTNYSSMGTESLGGLVVDEK
jgi:hypothetical protein